jgi:hypothetical protein
MKIEHSEVSLHVSSIGGACQSNHPDLEGKPENDLANASAVASGLEEAALNRAVLTRALVESGLLVFTRQRVAPTRQG